MEEHLNDALLPPVLLESQYIPADYLLPPTTRPSNPLNPSPSPTETQIARQVFEDSSRESDTIANIFRQYVILVFQKSHFTALNCVFVVGGLAAGAVAVLLSYALPFADNFISTNHKELLNSPLALIYTPVIFLIIHVFTKTIFTGTQGSGIPAAMTLLEREDCLVILPSVVSFRILVGKFGLLFLGLAGGGSMGKEGPMVILSASTMVLTLNCFLYLAGRNGRDAITPNLTRYVRVAIIAGAGAGIAAAFNSIMGGVLFAVEEFASTFDFPMGRCIATSVVCSMLCVFGLNTLINHDYENLSFFGDVTDFATTSELFYVSIVSGVVGGFFGGLNSQILLWLLELKAWCARRSAISSYLICIVCGGLLGALHIATGGASAGEGTSQVVKILSPEGVYCGTNGSIPSTYFVTKVMGTILTYMSGVCGGVFAPSLSAGSGLGQIVYCELFPLFPSATVSSQFVVICTMSSFFGGFTQSPLTTFSILVGMIHVDGEDYDSTITHVGMLTSSVIGGAVSGLINPNKLYHGMAMIIERSWNDDKSFGEADRFKWARAFDFVNINRYYAGCASRGSGNRDRGSGSQSVNESVSSSFWINDVRATESVRRTEASRRSSWY
ncbi:hypothetical protein TrVE_jg13261 [Triparma verrucosa]|uniref:Chloride channel protein n=1 Tax=Triparma verrucosa TaxID=1606542 RepID=A0A9W7ESF5_9STRA|nr:hypothetical protein TrVE_jg13261 [Triparma verrucosa]